MAGGWRESFRKPTRIGSWGLLIPVESEYDKARRVWNGMIDKRPFAIVRPRGTADVMATVRFASERGMPVSVRGGGHNIAGTAVADGGLMIDMSCPCYSRQSCTAQCLGRGRCDLG